VGAFINTVNVLPFDRKAAAVTARLMRELMDAGAKNTNMDDVFTAAVCMVNNAFLFARKPSRFDGIKGLRKV
jgi:predicted nucleic acid-binding protein